MGARHRDQCEAAQVRQRAKEDVAMSEPVKKEDAPAGDPALVAKLAEVFSAEQHLGASLWSLREWFNKRRAGEDFGLRLLDCQLWAANLEWLLVQAQIIAKGEEK